MMCVFCVRDPFWVIEQEENTRSNIYTSLVPTVMFHYKFHGFSIIWLQISLEYKFHDFNIYKSYDFENIST